MTGVIIEIELDVPNFPRIIILDVPDVVANPS